MSINTFPDIEIQLRNNKVITSNFYKKFTQNFSTISMLNFNSYNHICAYKNVKIAHIISIKRLSNRKYLKYKFNKLESLALDNGNE